MQHPEEGTIHAWLDGALPASQALAIEAHVASCAECEARVAEARGLIAGASRIVGHLDVVPGGVIPAAKPAKRSRWIFGAWPAAIAATLIIGIGLVSTRGKELPVLPVAQNTPGVIRPAVKDSMPVARSTAQPEPQPSAPPERTLRKPAAKTVDVTELPRPSAAMQKSSVAAAPPAPAPRPAEDRALAERVRAEARADEITAASAAIASANAGRALAGGMAAGAAAPPSAVAGEQRLARARAVASDSVPTFVGCYEKFGPETRTPVTKAPQPAVIPPRGTEPPRQLPPAGFAAEERYDRFALVDEAAPTPGQFAVRTLDPSGRPDQVIYGAGWSAQDGRAIVRDSKGQVVATILKTDSGLRSASVRVISCK